jgi:hypothetical protein
MNQVQRITELSRLINAAIVSKEFCHLLLTNPAQAMVTGYNGESFQLATSDQKLVLSIRANSLAEFALQLTQNRNLNGNGNGNGNGKHQILP